MTESSKSPEMLEFNRKALGLPPGVIPRMTVLRAYMVIRNDKLKSCRFNVSRRDIPEHMSANIEVEHFAQHEVELESIDEMYLSDPWATLVWCKKADPEDLSEGWWAVPCVRMHVGI